MTICIGALCANNDGVANKAVVVASDRMVTLGNLNEFEHEGPKIAPIRDKIVALMAGDALRASQLIREVTSITPPESPTVAFVAQSAAERYVLARSRQIEIEVFQPRGLTRQQFYSGAVQALTKDLQQLAFQIDNLVSNFNFNVDLLIAGVDDVGAHLYSLGHPGGTPINLQQIGYSAIGSGQLHALQSMIGFGQIGSRSIADTLFAVYAAKRRAEVAPGVGTETDLEIITHDGITRITPAQLNTLSGLYQEYQKPASEEIIDKVSAML